MDIQIVIFTMGIISTNINIVTAEGCNELKLEHTTEPAKIRIYSDIRNNEGHQLKYSTDYISEPSQEVEFEATLVLKNVANLTMYDQENFDWNREDKPVADDIRTRVSILCWVMTNPANHMKRAIHIKETWGKRCDILLFMSSESDPRLPTVKLPVREGSTMLWGKTQAAFRYIYDHHFHEADWFLKADDDTYIIVENLKYMLNEYNTNDLIYFGSRFKIPGLKDGYFSGGAGYVLSKEAVGLLVTKGLKSKFCRVTPEGYAEDLYLTICLDKLGVRPMDSRDEFFRGRFFPFQPHSHVETKRDNNVWYWRMIYYPISEGRDCCSEFTISFHYIDRNKMYALEYFIYHLKPYGISYEYQQIYN